MKSLELAGDGFGDGSGGAWVGLGLALEGWEGLVGGLFILSFLSDSQVLRRWRCTRRHSASGEASGRGLGVLAMRVASSGLGASTGLAVRANRGGFFWDGSMAKNGVAPKRTGKAILPRENLQITQPTFLKELLLGG